VGLEFKAPKKGPIYFIWKGGTKILGNYAPRNFPGIIPAAKIFWVWIFNFLGLVDYT